jgi:hypothetical protein
MSPALLVHIQAHLDEDLSLDVLSAKASLSPVQDLLLDLPRAKNHNGDQESPCVL